MVPFDVGCARCGHDLRGQTEPICPHCELTFDWADAVPIERLTCVHCDYHLYGLEQTRCPECGIEFTWEEALAEYHRRRLPWFEYRWRDRPIHSLLFTWRAAFYPGRFWRSVDIHGPTHIRPLVAQVLLALSVASLVIPVSIGVMEWFITDCLGAWSLGLSEILSSVSRLPFFVLGVFSDSSVFFVPFAMGAVWFLTSFLALLVFQQSMRRARVRSAQVFRVSVNSLQLALSLVLPSLAVALPLVQLLVGVLRWPFLVGLLSLLIPVLLYGHAMWSVRQAYRMYLRMPHAFAVALCSQVISILATITLFVVLQLRFRLF